MSATYEGATDPWYDRLKLRDSFKIPLTAIQVAAEQTPIAHRKPSDPHLPQLRAKEENAVYHHVQVSDFVPESAAAHLPDHEITEHFPNPIRTKEFKEFFKERGKADKAGIALEPCQYHVLEVKALRAYSPIFSRGKAFCALNNYHLAVMSTFVYGPFNVPRAWNERPTAPAFKVQLNWNERRRNQSYWHMGSIGMVLHMQLAHLQKPTLFNDAGPYHLLCEEVPYSKRLEIVPWDNTRYAQEKADSWEYPEDVHFLNHEDETQAFITHNDKVILISIRGTQEGRDMARDADARQVPHESGLGQAHRGFHEVFVSTKDFIKKYIDAFYTGEQTILVVGHSLGGAIALLAAEWIRRLPEKPEVVLYTYGAPRVGDATFVREANDLTHHRIVNHNDPVPGVPFVWMDAEYKTLIPSVVLSAGGGPAKPLGIGGILASLINMEGDNYQHHGEQRHFIPRKPGAGSEASILWQPGCASIEKRTYAQYAGEIQLQGDMPERSSFIDTLKSAGEHSSHTGYCRAALANLLRWRASVIDRNGKLFSAKEAQQLTEQVRDIEAQIHAWVPGTFTDFYTRARTSKDPRLAGKTQLELQAMFAEARARIVALSNIELKELKRARKRLQAQAEQIISWKDVFGDQADREDLDALLKEWMQLADIQKAARLAKVQMNLSTFVS